MNLSEEIAIIIYNSGLYNGESVPAEKIAIRIKKAIEKRIDILKQDIERRYELTCIKNNTGNPAFFDGEGSSLDDLLELLK